MKESDFSMLRFLDNEVDVKKGGLGPMDEVFKQLGFGAVVEAVGNKKDDRPEELGWIDLLDGGGASRKVQEEEEEVKEEEGMVEEMVFEEEEGAGVEDVFVPADVVE